ncbi:MAG: trigger factor [Candidatus Sumerlaeia bacterium]|nr:trigger factor [Candidatus Sumerlaeia bacterium]
MSDQSQTAVAESEKGSVLEALLEKKSRALGFTKVAAEKLPGSRWRFKVTVEEADAELVLKEIMKEFVKFAALPGFRPGKAPAALVHKRFEKQAREEMVRRITPRLAELAAEAEGLELLGNPFLMSFHSDKEIGTHVEFAIEVRPNVVLEAGTLDALKVEVAKLNVDDSTVAAALEQLRARNATYEPAKGDYAFQTGDGLLFDCAATNEHGMLIPDLSDKNFYTQELEKFLPKSVLDGLSGHKRGETVQIKDTYTHTAKHEGDAEAHEHSHTINYEITIREIKRRVLPALDDEFAKDVDAEVESLGQLKERLAKQLRENAEERTRREVLTRVYNMIGERAKVELPQSLLERAFQNNVMDVERRLRSQNMTLNQVDGQQRQQLLGQMASNTRTDLRNFFIANAVAKANGIEVTEDAVNAELARVAERSGRKPLAIRAQLEANKTMDKFKEDLRVKLVNDFLFAKAEIHYNEQKSGQDVVDATAPDEEQQV